MGFPAWLKTGARGMKKTEKRIKRTLDSVFARAVSLEVGVWAIRAVVVIGDVNSATESVSAGC